MKITYRNRIGDNVTFAKLDEPGKWVVRFDDELSYRTAYASQDSKDLAFVDPAGGPCITVGGVIPKTEYEITRICFEPYHVDGNGFEYFGIILYTKQ